MRGQTVQVRLLSGTRDHSESRTAATLLGQPPAPVPTIRSCDPIGRGTRIRIWLLEVRILSGARREVRGSSPLRSTQGPVPQRQRPAFVLVAQLAEASDSRSECWGFESLLGHMASYDRALDAALAAQVRVGITLDELFRQNLGKELPIELLLRALEINTQCGFLAARIAEIHLQARGKAT